MRCWWTCLFMLLVHTVGAQDLVTRSFPFSRQLFTNEVYQVYQDKEGYLWLGTTSSLQRWDGYRLLTFRSDGSHPHLMAGNSIRKMADTPSILWIVTEKGLTLYDKSNGQFFQPTDSRIAGQWIHGIHADNGDGMWLAMGRKLFHCDSKCDNVQQINPFSSLSVEHDIFDISMDRQGYLWVICNNGVLLRGRDGQFEQLPPIPDSSSACTMYQDAEGRYWVGTWGNGLWQCHPDSIDLGGNIWQKHHVMNTETGRDEGIFFCICQDKSKGWLWMLSYNKLYVLSYTNGRLKPVDVSAHIIPSLYYTSMICDREGNIWLTAYDGGYIVSFNDSDVHNYFISGLSDTDEELLNLSADSGYIWLNRQRDGLQLMNRQNGQLTDVDLGLPELATVRPARTPNSVWVAQRYYSTAYRLRHQEAVVSKEDTVDIEKILDNSRPIKNIIEAPMGTLWLLTKHHLVARSSQSGEDLFTADLLNPTAIILSGHDDGVLCAANGQLVHCSVQEHRVACRQTASLDFLYDGEEVIAMATEPNGNVWLATTLGRTFRSDSLIQYFQPSIIDSLLVDGLVQDMLVQDNSVWVMNNKRVLCYDIATGHINSYDAAKGIIQVEGFRHHALCCDTGGVLAGGMGGFLHLPEYVVDTISVSQSVPLILTDAIIDGTSIFFGCDTTLSTFSHILIPANAHNIEFHLSTLTYFPDQGTRMQYRMQEAEEAWTDIDPDRPIAYYNSLPCGTFTLQVRNCQENGEWGEPTAIATIERLPSWYETTLAYFCYLLILIVCLIAIVCMVRHRHARKLQSEVTQAKVAIITADHRLTDEIVKIIDTHLSDSNFSLEQLLLEMGMSKSTLYRQLKAETDMTPSDLIRSIRMKRAAEMLLTRKVTVSEVAYATGFSTPKYFTRCFKEEFGQTPSDYIRTHTNSSTSQNELE